ncbi:NADH-quinone oxidoreductase subunit NuoG [Solitalea koreensis]|uniref:NADH-quinone oxidoreductase subunit G n=1 Tax=Solitalea koreensis TaxID=543615 RepID=A0A521ALD7_9SPHI|nr:NADH-quinone oxidoreductase subunit NuoG [Solitalea koreensis]SMO35628.1 NADH dehydrogenase subunit G [Solitalea koreensis]
MATIYIDNKAYEVKEGKNLLETCLTLGFNLPYFCWHPAMGSVGACRQCAVKVFKDETDTRGRITMSCMESVSNELRLSISDADAVQFRANIIEWLMTNHPHDCAVCDEGGSCHLQDMTVMTGHNYRRFEYKKRTYQNQYLGPFINHEMNRCIQCYRCVRFYKDYAGGKDLDVFAAHNHVYFGRSEDGILQNEFSGNLAEVCPTGVFTDKTLKEHYTRKWDFTSAPSVCQHCSLGCNIIAAERYGELRQITSRYNGEVNGYFICDRGRFGYEFVNSPLRIKEAKLRDENSKDLNKKNLLNKTSALITPGKTIGIGSPRTSMESNFALRKLIGAENFYQGISEQEASLHKLILEVMNSGIAYIPSLKEVEEADAILVLGEDLHNSAPMLALAVRQAIQKGPSELKTSLPAWHSLALKEFIQQEHAPLFIANPLKTQLDELAQASLNLSPAEIIQLGYAIAHHIDSASPIEHLLSESLLKEAKAIAKALSKAKKPLIITGTSSMQEGLVKAAANIAKSLKTANLCFVEHECNSLGLAMMDAPPLEEAMKHVFLNDTDTVIILENDLYRRTSSGNVDRFFEACKEIIVIDHLHNKTTQKASVLIPTGTFAESDGTLINNEGRAQSFFQALNAKNELIQESWRWLNELFSLQKGISIKDRTSPHELLEEIAIAMPQFKGIAQAVLQSDFRINGQRIPREPHRYSGRTAMNAHDNVSEPKPAQDLDTPMSFTMEGYRGEPPSSIIPFYWSPGWNSVQSVNKFQIEIGGALHGGDPGIRLINNKEGMSSYYDNNFVPIELKDQEWLAIPVQHIYGSDELSIHTPGVTERSPQPYIGLNKLDAENLNLQDGSKVTFETDGEEVTLPLRIITELPRKVAILPHGLQDFNCHLPIILRIKNLKKSR